MQRKIKINDADIWQPDRGLGSSFETTYTEDSTRSQDGVGHFTPLFTVEQFSYSAKNIPISEASQILRAVAHGEPFSLYYFSPYYGAWRTDTFYVGKGSLSIGTLAENQEYLDSLSFNMTGVNPI